MPSRPLTPVSTVDEIVRTADTRRYWLAALAVVALAVGANWASLRNGLTLDDRFIVLLNPRVHRGEFDEFFTQSWWPPGVGTGLYRPLAMTVLGLEWAYGGGDPAVFHAVSLALHALVAVALYALAALLVPFALALAVAMLFAVHPVHVEAIAGAVGQAELLVALLLLIGLGAYVADRQRGVLRTRTAVLVAALGAAGLFAKENAVVLPALVVLLELVVPFAAVTPRQRWTRLLLLLGSWLALAVGWLILRVHTLGGFAGEVPLVLFRDSSVWSRTRLMLGVVPEWMRLLAWPRHLYAEYLTDPAHALPLLQTRVFTGALVLVGAVVVGAWARRRAPVVSFALAAFAVSVAPVANVVIPTGILMAERTLYLPSAFALLAAMAVVAAVGQGRAARSALGAVVLVVLVGLGSARGWQRFAAWRDDETVFRTLVQDAPDNAHARQLLGHWLFEHGQPASGEREYRAAMRLTPADASLPEQLGWRYLNAGMCAPAEPLFREALRVGGPRQASSVGLADCLLARGAAMEARGVVQRALAAGRDAPSLLARLHEADRQLAAVRRP